MFLQANFDINILVELLKQGPVIAGLVFAILYFYQRQQKLEANLQAANDKLESYLKDDRDKLVKVIENNTRIMQELETYLIKNN
jgi:hypothetical protein